MGLVYRPMVRRPFRCIAPVLYHSMDDGNSLTLVEVLIDEKISKRSTD